MSEDTEKSIIVSNLVSSRTGEGRVEIEVPNNVVQLSIDEARSVAAHIFEAIAYSDADACLVRFLREKLGADDDTARAVLRDFREFRGKIA